MEGCMREVRGLGEDNKREEERKNGRHKDDNDAMTMNNDDSVLPLPLQFLLP
jgi:hypothetical protein